MKQVVLGTATIGALVLLAGLPWAAALRRRRDGWVALLVDAALLGLVWLPLGVVVWDWLGWAGLAGTVLVWSVGVVVAVRRRSWPIPELRRLTGAETGLGVGWLAVLGVAVAVRLREVNFLPWIGDMGGYVNWANEFVRTGELAASWPPFFPAYLSVGTFFFGPRHTTVGMALTGLLLIVGTARLVQQVTGARWAALAAGATLAVQIHAVWYSSFPASESLNAPVFVLWVLLVHRLLTAEASRGPLLIAVGASMAALGLLRGSAGVLVVLLALLVVLVAATRAWRPLLRRVWGAFAASLIGFVVSYWYGITEIHRYYVRMQLRPQLPRPARRLADWAGVFDPTILTAVFLVLVVVAVVLVDVALGRRRPTEAAAPSRRVTRGGAPVLVVAAVAWAGAVVWQVVVDGEVGAILVRVGLLLVLGAALGLLAVLVATDGPVRITMLLLAMSSVSFALFHVVRLGNAREHAFHLYWDRYLVSEVLPAVVAMAWIGLAAIVTAAVGRTREDRRAVPVAACVVTSVVAVAVFVTPSIPQLRLATQDVFLRGAFDITEQLADEVGTDVPVVWSADRHAGLEGWDFFPNTWMGYAVPLRYTWGVDVVNAERGKIRDFTSDEVVEAALVPFMAACAMTDEFVLLDVDKGGPAAGERLDDPRLVVEHRTTIGGLVSLLPQRSDAEWYTAHVEVDVWDVAVRPEARITAPACWVGTDGGSATRMQTR